MDVPQRSRSPLSVPSAAALSRCVRFGGDGGLNRGNRRGPIRRPGTEGPSGVPEPVWPYNGPVESPSPNPDAAEGPFPLLTVGYGSLRDAEEFVRILGQYGVRYLVDVRSKPYSKFRPEFSKDALEAILRRAGIAYVFMGDSLGGLPSDSSCYVDGKVDYAEVRKRDWFTRGLDRLESGWRGGHRLAIMCAELEPDRCHRSKLIGESLVARGVVIGHIDEDGDVITHEAVIARLTGGQSALFGDDYTSRRKYQPAANQEPE